MFNLQDQATIAAIIAAIGGIISTVILFISQYSKGYKDSIKTILEIALETWKVTTQNTKEIIKTSGQKGHLYPVDDYLIHYNTIYRYIIKPGFFLKILYCFGLRATILRHQFNKNKKITDIIHNKGKGSKSVTS